MNTASICIKISAWLYLLIGGIVAASVNIYMLVPFFALALLAVAVAKSIDMQSKRAAWAGVVLLTLYSFSIFFFLGIPGLIGAYRARGEWMAWGEQA